MDKLLIKLLAKRLIKKDYLFAIAETIEQLLEAIKYPLSPERYRALLQVIKMNIETQLYYEK